MAKNNLVDRPTQLIYIWIFICLFDILQNTKDTQCTDFTQKYANTPCFCKSKLSVVQFLDTMQNWFSNFFD